MDITLSNTTKGIIHSKACSIILNKRSTEASSIPCRKANEEYHQPVEAICPIYRFSFAKIDLIFSSVKPKQAAKRLNASRLFSGIRAYMLLIGVSLFIAFCISFFFISFLLPYVCSNCTHTATDGRTPTSSPLYHPLYIEFLRHMGLCQVPGIYE